MGKNGLKRSNNQQNTTVEKIDKDSPTRSLLKAISWRVVASGTTFVVAFVIFRNFTEQTLEETTNTTAAITLVDAFAKLLFYYLHERLWTNIKWGKYWQRTYWARRKWKKLYNRMHEIEEKKLHPH